MGAFSRFSERFHGNKVPGFDKAGPGLWYPVMKVMIGGDICWISHILCWEYIWLGCFGIEFSQPPAMRSSIGPQTLQHVFFPHFALVSMENTLGLTIQWNFITRFLTCSLGRQRGPFFSLLIGLVRLVVSVFGDALKRGWLISNEPLPEAQALKSALGEVSKVQSFGCLNVLWSLCKKLLITADFDNLFLRGWGDCL